MILIGLLAIPGQVQAKGLRPWTVMSVSGDVRHSVDGGQATALLQGSQIDVGSKITTGPKSRAVLARGTESMTMSPRSEIAIPAETDGMLTRILQNLGTLLFKVEKRSEQHFEVKTPYLAAIVKGTTFTVSVNQKGSAVHVVSGLVLVNDLISGQSGLVRPGRTGVVTSRPGGGLKISGGRSNRGTKRAKVKTKKTKVAKADASGDSTDTAKGARKAGENKSTVGEAASSGAAKKAALKVDTGIKGGKGPAIVSALGIAKVNISAVTNGFIKADVGSGKSAGATVARDKKIVSLENANSSVSEKSFGGNGNAGGKGNDKAGGGDNGNAGGSSVVASINGNSAASNAIAASSVGNANSSVGGNPGGGNAIGISGSSSASSGNAGGNSSGGNAGGNSGVGNVGGNPGGGGTAGNPGGGGTAGNPGVGNAGGNGGVGNAGGNGGGGNAGGNGGGNKNG